MPTLSNPMALFYTLKQSQLCDALKRKVAKVLKNRPAQVRGENVYRWRSHKI